jgi:hypothetical protein
LFVVKREIPIESTVMLDLALPFYDSNVDVRIHAVISGSNLRDGPEFNSELHVVS